MCQNIVQVMSLPRAARCPPSGPRPRHHLLSCVPIRCPRASRSVRVPSAVAAWRPLAPAAQRRRCLRGDGRRRCRQRQREARVARGTRGASLPRRGCAARQRGSPGAGGGRSEGRPGPSNWWSGGHCRGTRSKWTHQDRHGRNLDRYLRSRLLPIQAVGAEVVPDHVGVTVTLGAAASGHARTTYGTPDAVTAGSSGRSYRGAVGQRR